MAKKSRDKGYRIEREIVLLHQAQGIPAARVPVSGSAGGEFAGDLRILDLVAEVKARGDGSGFRQLERWLGDRDLLFVRRDRSRPMVVMPWDVYTQLIMAYAQNPHTWPATPAKDAR